MNNVLSCYTLYEIPSSLFSCTFICNNSNQFDIIEIGFEPSNISLPSSIAHNPYFF